MATMIDHTREDVPPSRAVVEAVAAAEGVDPTELSPPLYTAIDPDVLDSIFSDGRGAHPTGQLVFEYLGYEVTVRPDGEVSVADPDSGSDVQSHGR